MSWIYSNQAQTVAQRTNESGAYESRLVSALPPGTVIASFVPPPPSVPQRVLRGPALKVIFTGLGKTKSDLLAMADALPDPQKSLMRIDIEESTHFERNNPTLLALAQSLSLTAQQLDDLFIAAAEI